MSNLRPREKSPFEEEGKACAKVKGVKGKDKGFTVDPMLGDLACMDACVGRVGRKEKDG
jgi:hypothetical protein